ncbi:MAG: ABC transporter ATP-binding protein/permease [Tenericutes bacterium]|nr:ABC transporter ATP-binding protein/permease [Mycoplasmatota bacterium]MDD7630331.1 ABC transporter ATP-binding protein [bacterium]MDY4108977.1 ABC transporter ATP-binding protein [Bacilli bacterium]
MPANRNKKFEKAKDFKSAIKRLLKELNPFKALVILSLTLSVAASILSIVTPNILSKLTDKISNGIVPNMENLVRINNEISSNFASGNAKDIEIDGVVISTIEQSEYLNVIKDIDKNAKVNELYSKIDEFPDTIKSLIKPSMDLSGITRISVFIGCLYLISAIFNYIESISMTIVSNKFAKKLRSSISSKINKLPLKYFDKNRTGDTLSRVTNDIDTVAQSMDNSLSTLVSASALFIGTLIMMFVTNALMAVTAILSSMIGFAFMFFVLGKSQKYFEAKQRELGNLNSHIEEVYSSLNVVKAYNGKELSDKKFDELNNKLYNANRKSQFLSGLMPPMMHFIGNFGYVAVCIVGALLTMNDVISFGVIIAFISYVRLFTSPLSQIAQSVSSLQTIAAASERVFEFIDEKEMKDESNLVAYLNKDKVTGNIEFDNVVFRYDGNDTDTIKNFSAKIKSGSKIAIVGPTGAGKTTIVNLLMKFYNITSGDIKIDGVSINDLKRENVHDLFTMVLQDTWVYEGTIKDNIIYNNSNVTDKDVEDVCKVVGLDHFIKTFSDGYNTMLVNNESVSAGQRQLLTIARGMLKNAPFLILDEATSNVDTRTEELVQNAMDKLAEGKTSFIIAHRLSTIKNADLILVMKDGNIVEQGNHDKLMKENGFYAKLYNSQFEL